MKKRKKREGRLRKKMKRWRKKFGQKFTVFKIPTCYCGAFMIPNGAFLECSRGCGTTA